MKILLANNTLALLAGSETFTYALAVELKRRGHEVVCYSKRLGQVSDRLIRQGITFGSSLESLPVPDVIHAHHLVGKEAWAYFGGTVPAVCVSHGVILEERSFKEAKAIVAVSEEVRDHYLGVADCIIRNAVDTKRFNFSPNRPNGKRVLFVSNYAGEREASMVERACNKIGASFSCVGFNFGFSTWDVEKYYYQADVVVGLGRTVLEAMSMGRNAVVFDAGHPIVGVPQVRGDGLVTSETYKEIRKNNFSGRRWNRVRTADALAEEIAKATQENGRWGAEIVRREHDIEKAAGRYVELYEKVISDRGQPTHA